MREPLSSVVGTQFGRASLTQAGQGVHIPLQKSIRASLQPLEAKQGVAPLTRPCSLAVVPCAGGGEGTTDAQPALGCTTVPSQGCF